MRALIDADWNWPAAEYPRFVHEAHVRAVLPDHLVRGEPYLALNAVVITREESELLGYLATTFSSVFYKAGQALHRDTAQLIEMGFPWLAAELLANETPHIPIVGRFDFVCDREHHWWLLEQNADTPSGVREALVVDGLVHEHLGRGLERPNAGLIHLFIQAFVAEMRLHVGRSLGLVTSASELEDLAQMAFTERLLRPALAEIGARVTLGDLDNLQRARRGVRLCGRHIDTLYRYVPYEGMLGTSPFTALCDAQADGRLTVLNGLFGLLLQHKGLLAWIWAHRSDACFEPSEQAAIAEHLAPTWYLHAAPAELEREALVAKQVFGREGEEVFFGEDVASDAWEGLRRKRTYVAQRRIEVAPLTATVATSHGPETIVGHATVGVFAVRGQGIGYYTRFGGKIITSRAKWLATFVE